VGTVAEGPLQRIARNAGIDFVETLVGLQPTDLQSVLLEVHRRLAGRLQPPTILQRYAENRFVRPAQVDPRVSSAFEQLAWSLLPAAYHPIELSPLCPLGTCSTVAAVDQNKAVATDRNVEVVSDSTNVLALEAALRRRSALREPGDEETVVRLAASQRQVRAQFYGNPRTSAHFRLLAVVTAGRALPRSLFECTALVEQVAYYVSVLRSWRPEWTVEVVLTDFAGRSRLLKEQVLAPLREQAPEVDVHINLDRQEGRGYYFDLCYKLYVGTESGASIEVGDGGSTDWTRRLLSDRRERLVIGGLGIERLVV
jgi:hypothetical protein